MDTLEAARSNGENGAAAGDGTNDAELTEARVLHLRQRKVRNQVWKTLCELKWRTPKVLEHMASTLGGGGNHVNWEALCRKFVARPYNRRVRASVKDYSFVFPLYDCDELDCRFTVPLTTYVLEGNDAVKFLKSGESGLLKLDEPVKLGNFACRDDIFAEGNDPVAGITSDAFVIKRSTGKTCELNHASELKQEGIQNGMIRYKFSSSYTRNIGGLTQIVTFRDDSPFEDLSCYFALDRSIFATITDNADGSVDFHITHLEIQAVVLTPYTDFAFSDCDHFQKGVTIADILSILGEDWV